MADFVLGTWRGSWDTGWTTLAAFSAAPSPASGADAAGVEPGTDWADAPLHCYSIFRHSTATGACEMLHAALANGQWTFKSRSKWREPEGWDSAHSLPHKRYDGVGGLLLLFRQQEAAYELLRVDDTGACVRLTTGYLEGERWGLLSACEGRGGSAAVLLYSPESGTAEVRKVIDDSGYVAVAEGPLAAANVGAGWTAVVPKQVRASPRKRTLRRFLFYSAATGLSRVVKMRLSMAESLPKPHPAHGDTGSQRKRGCLVVAVMLRGSSCCLFYKHNPPAVEGSTRVADRAGSDQPGVVLQRRLMCRRACWTSLVPLEHTEATGVGFLLCYSATEGQLWVCTLASQRDADADSLSPGRLRNPSRCSEDSGRGRAPFPPSPSPSLWPGVEGSVRSLTPAPPPLLSGGWSKLGDTGLEAASAATARDRPRPRSATGGARPQSASSVRSLRPWAAPPAEDPTRLLLAPAGSPSNYERSVADILGALSTTPFGAASGYANEACGHLRRSADSEDAGMVSASLLACMSPPPAKQPVMWREVGGATEHSVDGAFPTATPVPRPPSAQRVDIDRSVARLVRVKDREEWAEQQRKELHKAVAKRRLRPQPRRLTRDGQAKLTRKMYSDALLAKAMREKNLEKLMQARRVPTPKLASHVIRNANERLHDLEIARRKENLHMLQSKYCTEDPPVVKPKERPCAAAPHQSARSAD
eukprot:TRINITY_DN19248_c0_g1_i1.p1 TRINITY_DN19248_c0_g1~~TRINITY_DN19248_c0_g1_i1.p1  ORF type:complete len:718 (+),score=207.98 TRINITY_DN19248_c0_g1_i1:47-2155(+)